LRPDSIGSDPGHSHPSGGASPAPTSDWGTCGGDWRIRRVGNGGTAPGRWHL